MNQKAIMESLAMDLKRVAIGAYRGSNVTAARFLQEALVRKSEIDKKNIPSYIKKVLSKIHTKKNIDQKFAEDILMYSTLFQNYALSMPSAHL